MTPAAVRDVRPEEWPLPDVTATRSKHQRGTVLVVGGSSETPGALILAAQAALRSGAGRVQMLTVAATATALAVAVPEARVVGAAAAGPELDPDGIAEHADLIADADVVLLGVGACDPDTAARWAGAALDHLGNDATAVLDAAALALVTDGSDAFKRVAERTVLTPNGTEAAHLLRTDGDLVDDDPVAAVRRIADRSGATTALRMSTTYVATPGSPEVHRSDLGTAALATAGSGDVLTGIVAGLRALGAPSLHALVRGVDAHGRAGSAVAQRLGGTTLLARELLDVLPSILSPPTANG